MTAGTARQCMTQLGLQGGTGMQGSAKHSQDWKAVPGLHQDIKSKEQTRNVSKLDLKLKNLKLNFKIKKIAPVFEFGSI